MAREFHNEFGTEFRLITGKGATKENIDNEISWLQLPTDRSQLMRNIGASLMGLRLWASDRRQLFYTRDIAVAFSLGLVGANVVYEAHQWLKGKAQANMLRLIGKKNNFAMVTVSQALANHYQEKHNISQDRIISAHNGVITEAYNQVSKIERSRWRESIGIPDNSIVILHTGSLYKGGAELFGRVLSAAGENAHLVQVGGTSKEHDYWKSTLSPEVVGRVHFIPFVPHEAIPRIQRAADILLYMNTRRSPEYWCTSPLKVFEYMVAGTPIVGSSIGSVAEILNQENAFCYDPDIEGSLEAAVRLAICDPAAATARAKQASVDVVEKHTVRGRVNGILDFCRQRNLL